MSRRAAALALTAVGAVSSSGCRRTPELTETQMLRILLAVKPFTCPPF